MCMCVTSLAFAATPLVFKGHYWHTPPQPYLHHLSQNQNINLLLQVSSSSPSHPRHGCRLRGCYSSAPVVSSSIHLGTQDLDLAKPGRPHVHLNIGGSRLHALCVPRAACRVPRARESHRPHLPHASLPRRAVHHARASRACARVCACVLTCACVASLGFPVFTQTFTQIIQLTSHLFCALRRKNPSLFKFNPFFEACEHGGFGPGLLPFTLGRPLFGVPPPPAHTHAIPTPGVVTTSHAFAVYLTFHD